MSWISPQSLRGVHDRWWAVACDVMSACTLAGKWKTECHVAALKWEFSKIGDLNSRTLIIRTPK